jgi:hypothetical protein
MNEYKEQKRNAEGANVFTKSSLKLTVRRSSEECGPI